MIEHYSISEMIEIACKKFGIEYKSSHKDMITNDAIKIGEIITDLKIMAGELEEIADRHKIDGLKGILHKEALKIDAIDHELIRLSKNFRRK